MRLLHGFGIQWRGGELVIVALEGGAGLSPQRQENVAGFLQTAAALADGVEGNTIHHVLVVLPGTADAVDEATACHNVDDAAIFARTAVIVFLLTACLIGPCHIATRIELQAHEEAKSPEPVANLQWRDLVTAMPINAVYQRTCIEIGPL